MGRLRRSFFSTDSPSVAKELIGKRVVRVLGGEKLAGLIVEAEAYRGADDPASHAFRGKTQGTSVMFGEPGHAYVYFAYGNHWCLNLTAEPEGTPAAVLVRALEPQEGLKVMMKNRGVDKVLDV
ncbi:MAG: DNA-3-methyladenine glycosylase, partial [Thaumarchaeota archaeon]|nr:DNA-3-methyladenine glycosylase [Nitrososphaerota archaeon]